MGGNALSTPSVRLDKQTYTSVLQRSKAAFNLLYPNLRCEEIKSFSEKDSFGDLDLLVEASSELDLLAVAQSIEGFREIVKNGPVTSVGLDLSGNLFQVDFVVVASEEYSFAYNYFAFNDLGNLVGRVAAAMGLHHGHDGLFYFYREGDFKFREILLTRDYDKALTLLGFDPVRYAQGFSSKQEIFEYVSSSKFFNKEIYLLENRNHKSRIRDRKRTTYMEFLDYCEKLSGAGYEYPKDKKVFLTYFFENVLSFKDDFDLAKEAYERHLVIKSKFNGDLVSGLKGLHDKELGDFIKRFKKSISDTKEGFSDWVFASEQELINNQIKSFT